MMPVVLMVDDDENMLEIVSKYLMSTSSCRFLKARNGAEAKKLIDREIFQVAVLDAVLPDVSGFDLAEQIREKNPLVQVIMLTALSSLEDKTRALDTHIREFISKPVQMEELSIRIQANYKIYQLMEALDQSRKNYQNMIESFSEPVFILDQTMKILYGNPAFRNLYGQCGSLRDLSLFFPEEAVSRMSHEALDFLQGSSPQCFVDYKSDSLYYRAKFLRLLDRKNEILGILENTSGKKLEEKELKNFFLKTRNHQIQGMFLQKSLMPLSLPVQRQVGFQVGTLFSEEIGGDLFWFKKQGGKYYFVLSDVLGKGMGASYTGALIYQVFERFRPLLLQGRLKEYFDAVSAQAEELSLEYCVTALAGILDLDSRKLTFVSAGHNPPRILYSGQSAENFFLKYWGTPLGLERKEKEDYTEQILPLVSVDKLAFFSDGLIEFRHSRGKDIDYIFADTGIHRGLMKALESLKEQRVQGEGDDATLFLMNLRRPFREEIHISPSVNIDQMTEQFLEVFRDFDYGEKEIHAAFVVIQEMLSNMAKYCENGIFRLKVHHGGAFLLSVNPGRGFNVQKTIDTVSAAMNHTKNFPEEFLDNISLSGANLGLYMIVQNSDRFWATSDGRLMGSLIKRGEPGVDFFHH